MTKEKKNKPSKELPLGFVDRQEKELLVRDFIISYDRHDLKTTFNPEELNPFFDNKLKISWKNNLIEEYNRKLIYLTSN